MNQKYLKPSYIFLELTNACNASCNGCDFSRSNKSYKRKIISESLLKLLTQEIATLDIDIYLQSGEPLIFPKLEWFLKSISELKGQSGIHLTTNGHLIPNRQLSWHLFKSITFSIDGRDPIASNVRGLSDQENKIEKLIDFILKERKGNEYPRIGINHVVRPENQNDIFEFCKFWSKYEIDSIEIIQMQGTTSNAVKETKIAFPHLNPVKRHIEETDWLGIDPNVLNDQFQKIKSLEDSRIAIWPDLNKQETILFYNSSTEFIGDTFSKICSKPWDSLEVSVDGTIKISSICIELVLGHLETTGIMGAYNSSELDSFRKLLLENKSIPACARCCGNFGEGYFSPHTNESQQVK